MKILTACFLSLLLLFVIGCGSKKDSIDPLARSVSKGPKLKSVVTNDYRVERDATGLKVLGGTVGGLPADLSAVTELVFALKDKDGYELGTCVVRIQGNQNGKFVYPLDERTESAKFLGAFAGKSRTGRGS